MSINKGLRRVVGYAIAFSLGAYANCTLKADITNPAIIKLEKIVLEQKYDIQQNSNETKIYCHKEGQKKLYNR